MPLTGGTTATGRGRPPWLKENSTSSKPSWTSKKSETESSSNSGSDAKTETTPPRKISKVTITPKENGQKKEIETKLQSKEIKVPVVTEGKPSIPTKRSTDTDSMSSGSKSKSPSVASTDKSRSTSLASSDKSRSTTPASKKPLLKKEPSPEEESDELDSSEYEEVTVTETEEESEEEIERPVKFVPLRKVSKPENVVKEKSETPEPEFLRPVLKKVDKKPELERTNTDRSTSPDHKFVRPQLRKVKRDPSRKEIPKEKLPTVELKRPPPKQERELRRESTIPSIQEIKQENVKSKL